MTGRTPAAPAEPPAGSNEPRETSVSRDGIPLAVSMCHTQRGGVVTLFGEVEDAAHDVLGGMLSIDLPWPTSLGPKPCANTTDAGVVVGFAEGRGSEFTALPAACYVALTNLGEIDGIIRGKVDAVYVGEHDEKHRLQVAFAVPACTR